MRQNNITQQILARYLQKRLKNRAGSGQIGPPQLLLPNNDLQSIQKNSVENIYAELEDGDDDDIIGDTQYYQGQIHYTKMHPILLYILYYREKE